jgi:hypothetical protein
MGADRQGEAMDMQRNEQQPAHSPPAGTGPGAGPRERDIVERAARYPERSPDRFPEERMKTVYAITERKDGRSIFTRIGIGFVNRDDSITLKLDALPTSGTMQVRQYQRFDEDRRGGDHDRRAGEEGGRGARAGIPF